MMPFTPLHLGLGAGCKAIGNRQFSFMIFAGTQILMDIEPFMGLLLNWPTLHLFTHNLIGALLLGIIAIFMGKLISERLLKWLGYSVWKISWRTAVLSALIGSYSHVVLDAFMHHDMYPFFPFSVHNPLLGLVSYSLIFDVCIVSTVIGGTIFLIRIIRKKQATIL